MVVFNAYRKSLLLYKHVSTTFLINKLYLSDGKSRILFKKILCQIIMSFWQTFGQNVFLKYLTECIVRILKYTFFGLGSKSILT